MEHGDLVYHLRLSCSYHKKRAAFFDHWVRWPQLVSLFCSSFALVQLWTKHGGQALELSAAAAISSAIGLVFSTSSRLHLHNELAREFGKILAEAEKVGSTASAEQLNHWRSQRTSLETREPPQMTALVEHCQYEMSLTDLDYEQTPRPGIVRGSLKQLIDFAPMGRE